MSQLLLWLQQVIYTDEDLVETCLYFVLHSCDQNYGHFYAIAICDAVAGFPKKINRWTKKQLRGYCGFLMTKGKNNSTQNFSS